MLVSSKETSGHRQQGLSGISAGMSPNPGISSSGWPRNGERFKHRRMSLFPLGDAAEEMVNQTRYQNQDQAHEVVGDKIPMRLGNSRKMRHHLAVHTSEIANLSSPTTNLGAANPADFVLNKRRKLACRF